MNQTTAPTCPAPSTTASAELHAVADELRSGATVLLPATPATPAPTAPDTRRVVVAACSCDRRYRGESWAPPSVSVLSLPGVADQDIADAVGIAQCRMRSLQVMVERDGLDPLQAQAQANPAKVYADNAEKHLLAPRGLHVTVKHVL